MKTLFRVLSFTIIAVYLTSKWNNGFVVSHNPRVITQFILVITISLYLLIPAVKMILFPLNIATLGTLSIILFSFLLHYLYSYYNLVEINSWQFEGLRLGNIVLPPLKISYSVNLVLSSVSISGIITLLDNFI